jgi:hypothetical protein
MAAQLEAALAKGNLNRVKNLMRTTTFEDINKVYNNASGKKTTLNRVRSKGPAYAPIGSLLEQYGALSYEDSASMTIRALAKHQRIIRLAKNEEEVEALMGSSVVGEAGNEENMSPLVSPVARKEIDNSASVASNVAEAGNVENASPLLSPVARSSEEAQEENNSASLYNPESPRAGNYVVTPPPSPKAKPQPKPQAKPSVITILSERTTVHIPIKLATEIVPGKRYYMSRFFRTHIDIPGMHFIPQTRDGPLVSPISGLSVPVFKVGTRYQVIDTRNTTVPEKDRTYDVYTDIASGGSKTRRNTKRKTRRRKNQKI